jgi:hypothetical protein
MYTFKDLQDEVKRRATKDQSGTQFDTAVKNIINTSLFRINREAPWRVMRRRTYFRTKHYYEIGTGAGSFTNNNSAISVTGATFLTEGVRVGRRIKLSGDAKYYTIRKVTAETGITLDTNYSGTSTTTGTYKILGQEEYNLPVQAGHRMFLWHEEWGYPYKMMYITDQDFFETGTYTTTEDIPTHYRMWGEDMVIEQPKEASVMRIASSASGDTSIGVTVFGTVAGFPDYEIIITNASNGTTAVSGSKSFQKVERVVKNASTTGRITVDCNSANTVVAVLPVGDTTGGILYRKIQLYPLPSTAFDMNVQYYKDVYRLVNDGDIHELGQDFDEAIILLATSKIKGESEIKQGTETFFSMWQDEMKSLKKTNADKIDWFPTLRKPQRSYKDALIHPTLSYRQVGANYGPRVF